MVKITIEHDNGKIDQYKSNKYLVIMDVDNDDDAVNIAALLNYRFAMLASIAAIDFVEDEFADNLKESEQILEGILDTFGGAKIGLRH